MSDTLTTPASADEAAQAAQTDEGRQPRRSKIGQVVSDKMQKTIVVQTVARVPHPRFGKIVKQIRKFHVHDEKGEAKVGDKVRIMETRPISRLKRWRLVEILK